MDENGATLIQLVASALISGTVVSAVMGVIFKGYLVRLEQRIKSRREWKEQSVAELLGPLNIQFLRTEAAFKRWSDKNLFLEAKVVKESNTTIKELLLTKSQFLPPELLQHASMLIQHYDVWAELYEKHRNSSSPDIESKFVFAGPEGFPFPKEAEKKIKEKYTDYWNELYGSD